MIVETNKCATTEINCPSPESTRNVCGNRTLTLVWNATTIRKPSVSFQRRLEVLGRFRGEGFFTVITALALLALTIGMLVAN
ncbi:hypothetical protein P3T22_003984 [Paraburkholderia sp. GAS348]|jgi:hypothetical protein